MFLFFKTLPVRNRYSVERSFRISCSHPEYVRIDNDIIIFAGYKVIDVSITFLLQNGLKLPEVFVWFSQFFCFENIIVVKQVSTSE